MCAGPFKPKMPSGPTVEETEARESSRKAQRQALQEERRKETQIKEDQLETTQAALAGRRGRRSLLTGRRGGGGFEVADKYTTKKTLGA